MPNEPLTTIHDSEVTNFFSLVSQRRFIVPWHQRKYDWDAEHVFDLLRDVKEALDQNAPCHFLGSIMLIGERDSLNPTSANRQSSEWEINDGQQRIVTLTLICAFLCHLFHGKKKAAQERQALRLLFDIAEEGSETLLDVDQLRTRITPPVKDKKYFVHMLKNKGVGYNGKLTRAWRVIENFFSGMDVGDTVKFFEFLIKKVEMSCLYIPRTADHNFIFETINNRGKPLSDFDLIRNNIYSFFKSSDDKTVLDDVHSKMESIQGVLPKAPEYVRVFFLCQYGHIEKDNFYRKVKRHIIKSAQGHGSNAKHVHSLVESMAHPASLELYRIISRPTIQEDERFLSEFQKASGTANARRKLPSLLHDMQRYSITYPVIFAYLRRFIDDNQNKQLAQHIYQNLHDLCSFIVRTALVSPKFEPSRYSSSFSNIAKDIRSAKSALDINLQQTLEDNDSDYGILNDSKFKSLISTIELKDINRIKLLLLGIDSYHSRVILPRLHFSVEHVLPKSNQHWDGWTGFPDQKICKEYVHRLGNYALLHMSDNKPGNKFNANFANKLTIFKNSFIRQTREIAECNEWTPQSVDHRQATLVNEALKIWSFKCKR